MNPDAPHQMGGTASTPERLLLSLTPYDGSPRRPASPTMAWPGDAIVAVGEAERWRSPHRSRAPQRASALQCSACVWHCAVTHDWFTICQPPSAVTDLNPVNGVRALLRLCFTAKVVFVDQGVWCTASDMASARSGDVSCRRRLSRRVPPAHDAIFPAADEGDPLPAEQPAGCRPEVSSRPAVAGGRSGPGPRWQRSRWSGPAGACRGCVVSDVACGE